MKNKIIVILALIGLFASAQSFAVDTTATKKYPADEPSIVYEYDVLFSEDSLDLKKLDMIEVLPFAGHTATISILDSGTTPNWTIRQYVTNYYSKDTTKWTLAQEWDTTGSYVNKPLNDTLITEIDGMPFRFATLLVEGEAGNREDVKIRIRVALRKDD